ncbi:MAG TPA: hypothetical protein VF456_06955, partial [Vicinamibacterales bacterium]
MKAATTVLAAAVVWPIYKVARRVQLTSYISPANPEHAYATRNSQAPPIWRSLLDNLFCCGWTSTGSTLAPGKEGPGRLRVTLRRARLTGHY